MEVSSLNYIHLCKASDQGILSAQLIKRDGHIQRMINPISFH